jgi:hypothetical protein
MIVPAYSLTATERVLPKLALDFTTAALDARVTLTRALNTATRINSSGYIETINANLPRFDYTLNTGGACKGLLIEESRANIIQRWSDFTQTAVWNATSAGGGSVPTNTGNTTLSPDGVNNAQIWSFTAPVSGDRSVLSQTVPGLATGYWASTIFMKAGRAQDVGKVISIKETQGATYTLITLTDQWQRPESINTSAATTHGMAVELRPLVGTSTGTVQVAIWGAQTEAGAFVTSAIPNLATGTTTRNADIVDMTGTNFSDWYNATEGSIYAEYTPFTTSGSQRGVFSINDGSNNNFADWRPNGGDFLITSGNATQADMYPGGVTVNTIGKGVLAMKENAMACAKNGGTVLTDNTALMPVFPDRLNIGRLSNNAALSICGWMRKIMYWPQRITDAEVRAFSK